MAARFDPGSIRLRLRLDAGRARVAGLHSERPNVAAALRGKSADDAVRALPLLYSICGTAQGVAARLALAAARGEARDACGDAGVLAEARREHLWRLLLDWPQALGLARHEGLFVEARRHLVDADFPQWCEQALRTPLRQLEQGLAEESALVATPPALLPALTAAATLPLWPRLDEAFAAEPAYEGRAAETGALARHRECLDASPLRARVRARAMDLVDGRELGRTSGAPVAPNVGRASVETARGLLLHEVTLDGDRVADYRIVAPTEWNFHPAGVLSAWLDGASVATPQALRALAQRCVLALDPCVPAHIEIL